MIYKTQDSDDAKIPLYKEDRIFFIVLVILSQLFCASAVQVVLHVKEKIEESTL